MAVDIVLDTQTHIISIVHIFNRSSVIQRFIHRTLSSSPSAAAIGNAVMVPDALWWCVYGCLCVYALGKEFVFIFYTGRSLARVTNCHHRGGRSPSFRAGGSASVLGPSAGVSAWSWATWRRHRRRGRSLQPKHHNICFHVTPSSSADRTHLLVPALHPEHLPLLPLGKVVWVHCLLRGVPVVQHPLRDLQQQGKVHTRFTGFEEKYLD